MAQLFRCSYIVIYEKKIKIIKPEKAEKKEKVPPLPSPQLFEFHISHRHDELVEKVPQLSFGDDAVAFTINLAERLWRERRNTL